MGRGKRKRKAKQKLKRIKKIKQGKLVRFCLANSPRRYSGFSNKFCYQSNMHNLIYKGAIFNNVKFQNSNITECNFKNSKLLGVDFYNSNLKKSKFNDANLKDVIFFNCNLKGTNFNNVKFQNVLFISTNVDNCKNLNIKEVTMVKSYPKLENQDLINITLELSKFIKFYKSKVLHVKKNKVNNWNLNILYLKYSDGLLRALKALKNRKDKRNFITVYSYKKYIEDYLKIC